MTNLLNTIVYDFFTINDGIMSELCEKRGCDTDQLTFKAYLSRWMAMTMQMAPFTAKVIMPALQVSATAAMEQCSGTFFPNNCGLRWQMNGTWDGSNGPGQQMAALEVLLSTIIREQAVPLTSSTGGNSTSNLTAGLNKTTDVNIPGDIVGPITNGDKAGAWFLTFILVLTSVTGCYFMSSPFSEQRVGNLDSGRM